MENSPALTVLVLLVLSTTTTGLVISGMTRALQIISAVVFVSTPLITILWLLVQVEVILC